METQSNPIMNGSKYYSDGTNYVEIVKENISKYFKEIYVLVKKNDEPIPIDFYLKDVSESVLKDMQSKLIIWKAPMEIIKNKKIFDRICIIQKDVLQIFNEFGFKLSDMNVVLPILNISFKNISSYIKNKEGNNLMNIYNTLVVSKYLDDDLNNIKNNYHIETMIKTMSESTYWEMPYNCLSNLTQSFKNRKFNHSFKKKINDTKVSNQERENYLEMIFKASKYVDASSVIEKNGYKLYNIAAPCEYSKEDINQLFNILDEKCRFYLFANMMVSKKYCHLVVNNSHVISLMQNNLSEHSTLFRYLLGYSWLRFYFEESIKKRNLTINDEVVFDIQTASQLPKYPFSIKYPKMNPYMPIMVSDEVLKADSNIGGIKMFRNDPNKGKGICTLDEFRKRLNLFVTNNTDSNLFNDVEWKKLKIALGGSIMSACLQREHPLMNMFYEKTLDEKLIRYFNEYYASSDIDIMFLHDSVFDYMEAVQQFYNQIVVNGCIVYSPYCEPDQIKLKKMFQIHFCVNEDWVKKNIANENITFDFIFTNLEDAQIQNMFKPHIELMYKKYIKDQMKDFTKEEIEKIKISYPDFFCDIDNYTFKIHVYLNKETEKAESYDTIKINYKYRITSGYFNHPLEIFKIVGNDHMGAVTQFHLPCVRALYNGDNVYMTPSCVSAHMTYMNIDYKYFAGTNDPISIINKNRMRGFGTWLNEKEIKDLLNFSTKVPFWTNLYGKNNTSNLGSLPMSHKIFHPRMINADEYYDAPPVSLDSGYNDSYKGHDYLSKEDIISEILSSGQEIINTTDFQVISPEGYINPLQRWIIDAYYNANKMQKKSKHYHNFSDDDSDGSYSEMPPLMSQEIDKVD